MMMMMIVVVGIGSMKLERIVDSDDGIILSFVIVFQIEK